MYPIDWWALWQSYASSGNLLPLQSCNGANHLGREPALNPPGNSAALVQGCSIEQDVEGIQSSVGDDIPRLSSCLRLSTSVSIS